MGWNGYTMGGLWGDDVLDAEANWSLMEASVLEVVSQDLPTALAYFFVLL